MCGRFTLSKKKEELAEFFELEELPDELKPRYNISPTQKIAVVALKSDGVKRGLAQIEWGLLPADAPSSHYSNRRFNARSESIDWKPSFRSSFAAQRCLIPADGFYEWKGIGKTRLPYHFRMKDRRPFAFAGIWEVWKGEGKTVISTCLITTSPNALTKPIHDRMPVILPPEHFAAWLNADSPLPKLKSLLKSYPAELMEVVPVSTVVNSPKNESPDCLSPRAE